MALLLANDYLTTRKQKNTDPRPAPDSTRLSEISSNTIIPPDTFTVYDLPTAHNTRATSIGADILNLYTAHPKAINQKVSLLERYYFF